MSRAAEVAALTRAARFDRCVPDPVLPGTAVASGGCRRMMKVLLHGRCAYDCAYCGVRTCREDCSLSPADLADLFLRMWREGRADGLFLSSGIPRGVDEAMEGIVETGEILRRRGYEGYLHLKVLPGAARADITDLARVADRISINIEAPSASRLSELAGVKDYRQDIEKRQAWVADAMPGRHTTQVVVGAAGESDAEVLECMARQYQRLAPARIYYSGFTPLPGTLLASHAPTPLWRQNRLYQADALLRLYHFTADEVAGVLDEEGFLQNADPKRLLAGGRPRVDVNHAPLADLLRVPGIGPKNARRVLAAREKAPLRSERDLRACGVRGRGVGRYVAFGDGDVQSGIFEF
ncbi:putative DNA-binding helix-hairpin-helix protein [Methanofollis sp. W23]|uniref:radical SAM protein n=1 Tax=Methanofollis sp. W23 TaxID=2817849 RepID=UPI001AE86F25|nr:radical SAM protein [Methanofollis sp. W23]MBP2145524.1 putative DNA-binding helix-hairpin-helix protein [Methanofollis sp. W23]